MKNPYISTTLFLSIFFFSIFARYRYVSVHNHYYPGYEKTDMSKYTGRINFSDKEYNDILRQTGLGKAAVNSLKYRPDFADILMRFQSNIFKPVRYAQAGYFFATRRQYAVDNSGNETQAYEFAPLENGYVLITKSSQTLGVRNGHAALVVDAENGAILESGPVGISSHLSDISAWRTYPTMIMLKLKDEIIQKNTSLISNLINDALTNLINIPYKIVPGILSQKKNFPDILAASNCSHLIWAAFRRQGLDIDSDRGPVVTPRHIAKSGLFETVQLYGVNPDNIWGF